MDDMMEAIEKELIRAGRRPWCAPKFGYVEAMAVKMRKAGVDPTTVQFIEHSPNVFKWRAKLLSGEPPAATAAADTISGK